MADKQNLPLATVKQLLMQQREDFTSLINTIMKSFNDRFDNLQATVVELKVALEYSQKDIDELKTAQSEQENNMKSHDNEVVLIKDHLNSLTNKLDYIENQTRRNNVIFDGVPESTKETWKESEEKILNVLKSNMGFTEDPSIERAHRVGTAKPNKSRPVVVKFASFKDREAVLQNGKKLKGSTIYVREDLSEMVLERRRSQMDQLKEARAHGKIAYFNFDRLVIKQRIAASPTYAQVTTQRPTTRSQSVQQDPA